MDISFVTPQAALVGVLVLAPLAAVVQRERRSRRVCSALGLAPQGVAGLFTTGAALLLAGGLLALAAAQPVVATVHGRLTRTDAEAVFVFDISRSMAARERPGAPTRLERAKRVAKRLRGEMPEVPTGVTTLIDRALPHLFPTVRADVFNAKVDRALVLEQPPPERLRGSRATNLGALLALATQNFFGPRSRQRLLVVLTDGESLAVPADVLRREFDNAGVTPLFIHLWGANERVFNSRGRAIAAYRPDPVSRRFLEAVARTAGGEAFSEREIDEAARAARRALGTGPTQSQGRALRTQELAPYSALAAGIPLLLLLWRRNLKATL